MRLLYGIAGDGLGHAIRSSVIIEELQERGHEVQIVVSNGAADFLSEKFDNVTEIWGLTVETNGNSVSTTRTVASNLRGALTPSGLPRNVYKCLQLMRQFDPDVVISDHETWSWVFATLQDKPLVGLDNIHLLTRFEHPPEVIDGLEGQYPLAWLLIKNRVPSARHYLVSAFTNPEPSKPNTSLVPPVLRDCILEAEPSYQDHLVVYQTSYSQVDLLGMLRSLERPVHVYGAELDDRGSHSVDNVHFHPFNETEFVERLATCHAVVGSAGFTLITEALHLRKPYLALPVEGQIEQMLNARYLAWLGYGDYAVPPDHASLHRFLDQVDQYKAALQDYQPCDNEPTFEKLVGLLEQYGPHPSLEKEETRALQRAS